ncbi:MAG: rhodanese-like domain-containing protein [Nitrospirae bacterium]|nr:rhodanese-like domain-containing protein [Nitrospirota bacterium]
MKKIGVLFCLVILQAVLAAGSWAADCKDGEKAVMEDFRKSIPQSSIKSADDLFKKWQEIQAGTSKAVIIDIRTESEFDSGHIKGSNNVDSGHAYTMPEKWPDQNTEIWVFCRTQHRATYFVGLLYKYGYKNVFLVDKGIAGWIDKGYPLANKYLGEIKVTKYEKKLKEDFVYRENK